MIFFGDQTETFDSLKSRFPQYQFKKLKQTHSAILQEVTKDSPEVGTEGDALWTREKNLALVINTADCIPLLLKDPDSKVIAAVHAGWRGVENRLSFKTVQQLFQKSKKLEVHIGPHIQWNSFEVSADVREQLFACTRMPVPGAFRTGDPGKHLVNLTSLVLQQIREGTQADLQISDHGADTKTNPVYFSHRREPTNKGRQFSFIAQD